MAMRFDARKLVKADLRGPLEASEVRMLARVTTNSVRDTVAESPRVPA